MSKVIAIYDSDAIAYRASAVVDKRQVEVHHLPSSRKKIFNTRTEFKEMLADKGIEFNKDDYEFTDSVIPGELPTAIAIMRNQIERINLDLFADEVLMCIQGRTNFRDLLPLPSKYKGSRAGTIRPTWLRECKMYLYKEYPSFVVGNYEVDDAVAFKGYEYLKKGYVPVIIGVDKDAYSYSGLNIYDYTKEQPKVELIPDFGSLYEENKKIKGRGFIWLMFQLILGDQSDCYKPTELAGIKYGEKSAYAVLKNCTTKKEALEVVIEQYKRWYPTPVTYTDWSGKKQTKDYKQLLQLYFSCARMMQYEGDKLDFKKFCKEHQVNL